ncbi:MAG: hypothetical protein ACYDH6_02625 [Acidimicrobiales bacterium]
MKKGRHRRFEEARALKQTNETVLVDRDEEPCVECGADPGRDHASWCMATADLDDEGDGGTAH